jgi:hypothetical protein
MTVNDLLHDAREHASRLKNDIELCSTREEHIRISARANEADRLVAQLVEIALSEETANTIG